MKLFPAKCHERATLRKLWRQTGNSSLLPGQQFTVDCCCKWWLESQRGFQILLLSFVLLYNKSLNDWSLGEQWILFPSNLNVSLDFVSGNIEILGKQNSLFPSGPVIKCLLLYSSARFSKFAFVLFCYITNHLMTGPLGNSEFCFPRISMFPSTSSRETLRFSGNKIHCSPRDQSLSVKCKRYFPFLDNFWSNVRKYNLF